MRIIAGILMMIVSFTLFASVGFLTTSIGATGGLTLLSLLLVVFVWGNAIDVFMRKRWKWAFTGAICSVLIAFTFAITLLLQSLLELPLPLRSYQNPSAIVLGTIMVGVPFVLMSILSVVFLMKRKREFQS